jgi:hypothetical protein
MNEEAKAWDRASVYDWTKFEKDFAEENVKISEKQKQELLKHYNERKNKWAADYSKNSL